MWFDRSRNLIIYPRGPLLVEALPGARALDEQHIAVERNLHNAQLLRWRGLPVPPIIDDAYDWPAAPPLRPYDTQRLQANFLVLHPRSYNFSDMGTGKTLAALWAADWLMRQYPRGECRTLIVAPLSTLERVWGDAVFKHFLGRRTHAILHGTQDQRIEGLERDVDFYIVNHDGIPCGAWHDNRAIKLEGFSKRLSERPDIKIAVVDEASAYRDGTTLRNRVARKVFGEKQYLWLFTGTPTPNAPTDAYGLARLANKANGVSFTTFRDLTMTKMSSFRWEARPNGYEEARKLLTPAIRIAIEEVWDAPPVTTQQRQVPLTDRQKSMLADLKRDAAVKLASGELIAAVNEAAVRTKVLQVAQGAIYDEEHVAHGVDAKPRIDELRAVIEEAPGKVLIFASFTSIVSLCGRALVSFTVEIVEGATNAGDRARIFSTFQDQKDPRILIANPSTMAHGIDLWRAQTVIWFGPTDKTELYLQANARAHRPGQKFPVTIVQLVATATEREVYRRIANNESLQGSLLAVISKGEI